MRVKNTLAAAAALSLTAVSAIAGGYDAEIVEQPIIVAEPVATGSLGSLGGTTPVLIALGVLGVAAAISASDDDDQAAKTTNFGIAGGPVFKSTDGGKTWSAE